eukprot:s1603_g7.t7
MLAVNCQRTQSIWELHMIWAVDPSVRALVQLEDTTAVGEGMIGKNITRLFVPKMKYPNRMSLRQVEILRSFNSQDELRDAMAKEKCIIEAERTEIKEQLDRVRDALGAYSQWTTKQLRSHRDAVARLAAAHVQLQQCISADLVDGKANFASAVVMLTEMPRRMQAMEDRVQTLECRVQLLNDSTLSPQPQPRAEDSDGQLFRIGIGHEKLQKCLEASSNALKAPPSISDKPSDEAVRECRQAVGVMLSMQQNMKQELAAIEEQMCMRSNDFEASLRAAANANHDAVHALFASHSQEVEALYARSAACEEGLQDLQTQSSLLAEWKDGASSDLFEHARRLTEVEKAARAAEFTEKISAGGTAAASRAASKTAAAGLDEGLRASVVPEDAGQLIQATRATSKIAVAQGVASDEVLPTSTVSEDAGQLIQAARATSKIAVAQSVASDEAVRNVQEVAIKALDVAQKALLIAEETRAQGSKTCKDGDKLAPQKAAGTWPCRPRVLQGCLPYLPPSSLAHEIHRPKQRSPGCRKDRMNGSWHDRSPSSSATDDSDLKDDTELGPLPQPAELREAKTPALVLLAASGGGSTARGRTQQEEEKERFLPPTGGCFRHLSPHSRLGSRNTRPLTAERPQVVHRGGAVRPSTAGHL